MKLYMFWTFRLYIIRSLFTVHSAMVYVIQVCRQLSSRTRMFYMFRTVRLSIIRVYSLYIQQCYMSYRFVDSCPSWSCSTAVYEPVWQIPLLNLQWINSWWWTDEISETCRVSWQNKFVKLGHLVGLITKKPYSSLFSLPVDYTCGVFNVVFVTL